MLSVVFLVLAADPGSPIDQPAAAPKPPMTMAAFLAESKPLKLTTPQLCSKYRGKVIVATGRVIRTGGYLEGGGSVTIGVTATGQAPPEGVEGCANGIKGIHCETAKGSWVGKMKRGDVVTVVGEFYFGNCNGYILKNCRPPEK